MKKIFVGSVVLAAILLAAVYWYTKEQKPSTAESFSTFTCGDFTFTYPSAWYAWKEDMNPNYSNSCTVATFPQSALEEKVSGIAHLTKNEQDAFIGFYATPDATQSLGAYIDSIYCKAGETCMEPYIESKTAIPFENGEAFKVVDTGGEYPASISYYYKKGDTVMLVSYDMKNQKRASEILSIVESVQ